MTIWNMAMVTETSYSDESKFPTQVIGYDKTPCVMSVRLQLFLDKKGGAYANKLVTAKLASKPATKKQESAPKQQVKSSPTQHVNTPAWQRDERERPQLTGHAMADEAILYAFAREEKDGVEGRANIPPLGVKVVKVFLCPLPSCRIASVPTFLLQHSSMHCPFSSASQTYESLISLPPSSMYLSYLSTSTRERCVLALSDQHTAQDGKF